MFDGPADEATRFVLDESTLDFATLGAEGLTDALEDLLDVFAAVARDRATVCISPFVYDYECLPGVTFADFLFSPAGRVVSRDLTRRLAVQLDRCATWSSDACGGEVVISGKSYSLGFSVEYAARAALAGHMMACLVLPGSDRVGRALVQVGSKPVNLYFLDDVGLLVEFWRSLYDAESVPEADFRHLALRAFPQLALHPQLTFRGFAGAYQSLRDQVVAILGVLNDHFVAALAAGQGIAHRVQAELGSHGVEVSPESPKTRASHSLMRQRDVEYEGSVFRCEWHAKLEPHRNRIHFSLPAPELEGRILIGIFAEHLGTGG